MKFLLDTQTFLWWLGQPAHVNAQAAELLEGGGSDIYFSAVSSWEIAIKYAIGKLPLPHFPETYVTQGMAQGGFLSLPVQHAHAHRVAHLPPHHADPFDRLLVAQAQVEGLSILTSDRALAQYDVTIIRSD